MDLLLCDVIERQERTQKHNHDLTEPIPITLTYTLVDSSHKLRLSATSWKQREILRIL